MNFLATHAPVIGLLFFVVVFGGVLVTTLRPGAKQRLESYGTIPLKDADDGR